jgi:hypothetical protein
MEKHMFSEPEREGNSSRPTGSFHFPQPKNQTNPKPQNRTFLMWLDTGGLHFLTYYSPSRILERSFILIPIHMKATYHVL